MTPRELADQARELARELRELNARLRAMLERSGKTGA